MAKILSIETSTQVCSVSIHDSGEVISNMEVHAEKSHARFLTHLIAECCRTAGIALSGLDAVAVSKGPGSYTGLRIGVSTAKGLCFSLEKPLIVINTLEAMAEEVRRVNYRDALLVPMLDARRMEVYTTILNSDGEILLPTEAHVITSESFLSFKEDLLLFGNGAEKCRSIFAERKNIFILNGIYPAARNIGILATQKFKQKDFADLAYFEPFYLKDFVRLGSTEKK